MLLLLLLELLLELLVLLELLLDLQRDLLHLRLIAGGHRGTSNAIAAGYCM